MNPTLLIDGYKVDHRRQYPNGTQIIFSNMTARKTRRPEQPDMVFFGLQYFVKEFLINRWNAEFFNQPKDSVVANFTRRINSYLGPNKVGQSHIEELHNLGYLPLEIRALPEGSIYPIKVPCLVMWNTDERFFWITNYLETILSSQLWGMSTSATTARQYRLLLDQYAKSTVGNTNFTPWQGHDFSFRGMFGLEAACMSGAGHLTSFTGTDTLPAIDFLEKYYNANSDSELIGGSVAATEHSVMCAGGMENELETFKRLINDIYPSGIVSIVSDSWDYWQVITNYSKILKQDIMARDGKVVFRPDTGDPVKIVCGDPDAPEGTPEYKGSIECLWDIFGGTVSDHGYRLLDSHVGLIYGDSITLQRAKDICEGLKQKGFASTNIVFGIGSYTYQYVTRDTDGFAVKATWAKVNGDHKEIFKAPKTDDGTKKSAKGLTAVFQSDEGFYLKDQATWEEVLNCSLEPVFKNGQLIRNHTLTEIRTRIHP